MADTTTRLQIIDLEFIEPSFVCIIAPRAHTADAVPLHDAARYWEIWLLYQSVVGSGRWTIPKAGVSLKDKEWIAGQHDISIVKKNDFSPVVTASHLKKWLRSVSSQVTVKVVFISWWQLACGLQNLTLKESGC